MAAFTLLYFYTECRPQKWLNDAKWRKCSNSKLFSCNKQVFHLLERVLKMHNFTFKTQFLWGGHSLSSAPSPLRMAAKLPEHYPCSSLCSDKFPSKCPVCSLLREREWRVDVVTVERRPVQAAAAAVDDKISRDCASRAAPAVEKTKRAVSSEWTPKK